MSNKTTQHTLVYKYYDQNPIAYGYIICAKRKQEYCLWLFETTFLETSKGVDEFRSLSSKKIEKKGYIDRVFM